MLLRFKDKTSAECEILGSIEEGGIRYAVFLDPKTKHLHVYKYKQKKKKCKLFPVTDSKEFRRVCQALTKLIGEKHENDRE